MGESRLLVFGVLFLYIILSFQNVCAEDFKRQMIFIGVDGMQVAHFNQMLNSGKMPNFQRLINNGGWVGNSTITGHTQTETSPGNAELHTGLGSSLNGVSGNDCTSFIPLGKTSFERLKIYNSSIKLGLVYGKGTCYIPDSILRNAKPLLDFWHNRSTYSQTTYVSSNCAYSQNASNQAIKFIDQNKNNDFYVSIYFGVPDCAGHSYGENSVQYDNSLINVDAGLGIILDYIQLNNLNTSLIISGDHGWNEGTTGHATNDINTKTIILASNNISLVKRIYSQSLRKQCDVAPTILNYFGMNKSQYSDITNFGCGSMIESINGTCGENIYECTSGVVFNLDENLTHYNWECLGKYEGRNAFCSNKKYSFFYHYSDLNLPDKIISSQEIKSYIDLRISQEGDIKNMLYALTLFQSGGKYNYTGADSSSCSIYPWNCWKNA